MAQQPMTPELSPPAPSAPQRGAAGAWPPEVADLLGKVERLLAEGEAAKALDAVVRAKAPSPWATHALGVCQLRLGNAPVAVDVFRGLVLAGLVIRDDAPTVFKTNYATALLAAGNMTGGLRVLEEVRDEGSPAVQRLRGAIRRWENSLTFWQKLNWWFGGQPGTPLVLDLPLGDLG